LSHPDLKRSILSVAGFLVLSAVLLSSCDKSAQRGGNTFAPPQQAQVISAQDQHQRAVEVTVTAPVKRILPDDTEGLPHQRFLLQLANGSTVLVAHNTNEAPRVPIAEGDLVTIHGEYGWNAKGGFIHWTHHSDTPRHEGGYIDFNGQRFQ
jgi:hypothetical protein